MSTEKKAFQFYLRQIFKFNAITDVLFYIVSETPSLYWFPKVIGLNRGQLQIHHFVPSLTQHVIIVGMRFDVEVPRLLHFCVKWRVS